MDEKAKVILQHYKNKIEEQLFDEYDILGFLIFVRSYIGLSADFKTINEFSNLIAHRKRDRGRVMESIEVAIKNNYEVAKGTKKIKGYNGIHYNEWEKEWYKLGEKFDIKFTPKIIKEVTICIFSIAQFTEYKSGNYSGRIEILRSENSLHLVTTEGEPKSLFITFFIVTMDSTQKIESEKFYPVFEPVEAIRINGKLELREIRTEE